MKRSELAKGMRVAISRSRDWQQYSVAEAYVLDAATTYINPQRGWARDGAPTVEFDDPRNPGVKVTAQNTRVARTGERGSIATLKKGEWGTDPDWKVELIPAQQIVGSYEEASATIAENRARKEAARKATADRQNSNADAFLELRKAYPALDNYRTRFDAASGTVTIPLDTLKNLLAEAAAK